MNRGLLRLAMALAALTVAACSDDEGTGPGESMARLRVVHAVAELTDMDVSVDEIEMVSDLFYLDASEYLELEAGSHSVVFLTANGTVDSLRLSLAEGVDYTVLPCCAEIPGSLFLTDDNTPSQEGNARVRVVHFANAPALDMYLTEPEADLEAETAMVSSIRSFEASEYLEVPSEDYQIRFTNAGSKNVAIEGGTISLGSGQVRTVIAVDTEGGGEPLFSVLALEDAN